MYKIRSLAPSQRGKRSLLSDISQDIKDQYDQSENYIQEPKRRITKNNKDIQIPERKAILLSDNQIYTVQKKISEHVSLFLIDYLSILISLKRNIL
jgi:hypothetical protein